MSEGLNRVMLIGNLGADPEMKGPACKLRMACTESYFDKTSNERKEVTEWVNVTVFGKRGEAMMKLLRKGSRLHVEGKLHTSSYEKDGQKRYSTEVIASGIVLLDGKGAANANAGDMPEPPAAYPTQPRNGAAQRAPAKQVDNFDGGFGDDIPF